MRRFLIVVGVLLLVFWIATAPTSAAGSVQDVGNAIYNAASNVTTFFDTLF